ncbi:unnamed protein product [Lathyrus oleraceus]
MVILEGSAISIFNPLPHLHSIFLFFILHSSNLCNNSVSIFFFQTSSQTHKNQSSPLSKLLLPLFNSFNNRNKLTKTGNRHLNLHSPNLHHTNLQSTSSPSIQYHSSII